MIIKVWKKTNADLRSKLDTKMVHALSVHMGMQISTTLMQQGAVTMRPLATITNQLRNFISHG